MFQKYIWVFVILTIVVAAIILFKLDKRNNSQFPTQSSNSPTQTSVPVETSTPLPTATPTKVINNTPVAGGITRGEITCEYLYPPIPNNFGSANIVTNWNNLVLGKNGTAKLAVCVSVNESSNPMSVNTQMNGSMSVSAPWISLDTDYVFTLYDDHGGDLPDCGGIVLASCHIKTNVTNPSPGATHR
jgi:hypothetical protein